MAIETHKYKLGIFVLTGIGLLIVSLFLLGLSETFKPKINFITYFDESVQGLEQGSAVKFRGVTIGRVKRIAIRPTDNFIRVDMQAMPSSIDSDSEVGSADFFNNLDDEVRKGLRCRLELKGITGMKYVELDYVDPKKNGIPRIQPQEDVLYVPSAPSLMSGLRTSLTGTFAKIAAIDFEKISRELSEALGKANELLSDPKIAGIVEKLDKVAEHSESVTKKIDDALTKKRMEDIAGELDKSLKAVREFSTTAKEQLRKADVPRTAASVRKLKREMGETLRKLDDTLDSLTELINSLQDDPSSLVRGKKAPKRF
jgi:ABC-type transporter Mla subunit MlaD